MIYFAVDEVFVSEWIIYLAKQRTLILIAICKREIKFVSSSKLTLQQSEYMVALGLIQSLIIEGFLSDPRNMARSPHDPKDPLSLCMLASVVFSFSNFQCRRLHYNWAVLSWSFILVNSKRIIRFCLRKIKIYDKKNGLIIFRSQKISPRWAKLGPFFGIRFLWSCWSPF